MEDYEYMRVPIELAVKLKELENEDALYEKEVLCYIERTKKDISNQVELLDDDILMFKGKLASYKKAFKEAYSSADTEMYSFWEDFDKKLSDRYTKLDSKFSSISKTLDREFQERVHQVESLSKRLESLNIYNFEKIITFLESFETLNPESKELFVKLVGGENERI